MNSPFLPFFELPFPDEWARTPDSDFARTLQCALHLIDSKPELVARVKQDLDRGALAKKQARRQDRIATHRGLPFLPGAEAVEALPLGEITPLEIGRPRMKPEICLFFLIIRGYLGGMKSRAVRDFLSESTTLRRLLALRGTAMPSFTTILENVNQVSQETLEAVFDAQIGMIKDMELDTFDNITADSTACRANSRWPTDSSMILFLARRLWRFFQEMSQHGVEGIKVSTVPESLDELHRLDFEIAMVSGRKEASDLRKTAYTLLLDEAEVLDQLFTEALEKVHREWAVPARAPSLNRTLEKKIAHAAENLRLLSQLIANASRRVLEEKAVPQGEKIPSVTDPSAAFISKGQRETVVGYRPQISKSARGFVTALIVPEGNAADASQALPLHKATVTRTGIVPKVTSWDDGYSSENNREALLQEGVETVSFSGSKGKKITPLEQWESESHGEARRMRSAVESVIYQLKQGFGLGEIMRRTIAKVRAEMTWKVLAFNFYRIQYLLR